jgi:imidazolonepropionase-like amidohydrolase
MSRAMRLTAAVALGAALSAPANAVEFTPEGPAVIALVGGTVHPVSGPDVANGTVVIRDGKIAAVGAGVSAPEGATVVDCRGRHVYPGMIAANTILGLVEVSTIQGAQDQTETGQTNPNIRAEVQVNPDSDLLPVTRINGITSALVIPRGGAINGTSALMHLDGWTEEDMTVSAPVALHVQWPNMNIVRAFFETRSEEEQKKAREEQIAAITKSFDDARAYSRAKASERTPGVPRHDADAKWDAMRRAIAGEIPVVFQANSAAQIRAVLRFADEQKLSKLILLGGRDAWRFADELRARKIPVIYADLLATPSRGYESYDAAFTGPAKLLAAGIPFCIADAGTGDAHNSRNLPYHAAMAAAHGLPEAEALKSVTLSAAQILGVADRVGSIDAGKFADLVVTDGDLLDVTTHVEQVYIAGKAIPMESRQTRLFHKYDSKPRGAHARAR